MNLSLSPRETEILSLVASGKTTKEIGAVLSIAESTVNWHVANMHAKLGAASRAEAVAIAMGNGKLAGPPAPSEEGAAPPSEEAGSPSETRPQVRA
jgi:DNA-binding CsgD family transcriptional regulator